MDSDVTVDFSSDKPLKNPQEDSLGGRYSQFSEEIANQISNMAPAEGFVIAIDGAWGSGKSTVLNFIEYYLKRTHEPNKPIIIRFNPWWFNGKEHLLRLFFDHLLAALNKELYNIDKLKNLIAEYANALCDIPYIKYINQIAQLIKQDKNVIDLKDRLAAELQSKKKKIVVIIDDVDRLENEEIRQLFRVIKAVADFPYITYLLAFSRDIVVKAVNLNQDTQEGDNYLEKIIQVPLQLPLLDNTDIHQMLAERLNSIVGAFPPDLFQENHWYNIFNKGIKHFFNTPRNVVRFINVLRATYPVVKGEVNIADFLGIEAIRIFHPKMYNLIKNNPEMFYGEVADSAALILLDEYNQPTAKTLKPFHDSWLNSLAAEDDREVIKELIISLFPKLSDIEDKGGILTTWTTSNVTDHPNTWKRHRRICDPELFPIYFRYGVSKGELSRDEFNVLIEKGNNPKEFENGLLELLKKKRKDGTSKARSFLERMDDTVVSEIPDNNIVTILNALINVGDNLIIPEDSNKGIFKNYQSRLIFQIVWRLINRVDRVDRAKILEDSIKKARSVFIPMLIAAEMGKEHGLYRENPTVAESERTLSLSESERLIHITLNKTREYANEETLLNSPNLVFVLYRWKEWEDEKNVKEWVQKSVKDKMGLLKIVISFGEYAEEGYHLDSLQDFIDPHVILDDVKKMIESDDLEERGRFMLKKFIGAVEAQNNPN